VDDSATVYTFTLRDGIAFHDGRPITAHDFKYSIERAAEPELHSDTAPLYLGDIVGMHERLEGEASEVSGVEVVDARTLRITIDAPKQYFLAKLTYPVAAAVDRETVEGGSEEWWLDAPINGSGAYKLMLWEEGEAVVLERNDDYHTPADLEYFVSPNTALPGASALGMYHSYAWDAVSVGLGSLDFVRETPVLNAEFQEFDQLTTYFVVLDNTLPPFDDLNVRRAFSMALDREALIEEVYGGGVTLARGLLPPGMPGYSAFLRGIRYDPEAARQALARSAYADDFPPTTFSALDDGGEAPPSIQFMLAAWEEVLGIEVGVDLINPEVYSYELESVAKHLFTYGWVADYPDPENFLDLLLHSSAHDARYANPTFDRLVEQARVETDRERRLALYHQAEQLLIDDAGIIPLFHVKDYALVAPYVRGFDVTVVGQPDIRAITLGAIAR
ncbi:MAG: peptide ABC transporter substrate-binding protein, partial [Chloroflexota bacterium]|nr:peptide ABC transporter substrate-binding protein [Chloroflexota bacterium]